MDIQFVTGDATRPQGPHNKIIAHGCNDIGVWGSGFVTALSLRFAEPEDAYRRWHASRHRRDTTFRLGEVQLVQVREDLYVLNMLTQHGIRRRGNDVPLSYEALDACLSKLADRALDLVASVHMPRVGCGLAGGEWEQVGPLVARNLVGLSVTVYDLPETKAAPSPRGKAQPRGIVL